MLGVYGTVAALGYYYFGSSAHTLVTTDLARNSAYTGHYLLLPGLTVDTLVSVSILLNAYSTYPSLVLVMQVTPAFFALSVHANDLCRTTACMSFKASLPAMFEMHCRLADRISNQLIHIPPTGSGNVCSTTGRWCAHW